MSGRVLSDEEIQELEKTVNVAPHRLLRRDWKDLIATIRDRDKTISELRKQRDEHEELIESLRQLCLQKREQNTILIESLEWVESNTSEHRIFKASEEALAKVKDGVTNA